MMSGALAHLAREANNHFGIKCKNYWTGKTYYYKDDDFNRKGQLIESCFRAYETDIDSYIDRSNFLSQTERYSPLFNFDKTDYTAWAYGLKFCGYATDDNYAQKLISKIEKYNLYLYDTSEDPSSPSKAPHLRHTSGRVSPTQSASAPSAASGLE